MKHRLQQQATVLIFILSLCNPSYAALLTFTDRFSFENELSNLSLQDIRVLNFEGSSPGDPILSGDTLRGITFTYLIEDGIGGTLDMMVADQFDTTSGNNYLGLDDPGNFDQFIAGDSFSITLDDDYQALGMYFITGDPLFSGDIILQTALGNALNSDIEESTLTDGSLVYFIGLISSDFEFNAAEIRFDPAATGAFLFNVDDIAIAKIPEPSVVMLFLIGLLVSSLWQRPNFKLRIRS